MFRQTYFNHSSFKKDYTFDERLTESSRVISKYPDRVPIICEKSSHKNLEDIDKKKYLVPSDLTMGQFVYVIRKRLKLKAEESLFLFINNSVLASTSEIIGDAYYKYKDPDGFLYINYAKENVFGGLDI